MFFWKVIYTTRSYEEYIKVKKILQEHRIKIKSKIKSDRNRLSNNVVLGGNPLILNSVGVNKMSSEYAIYVKSGNVQNALFLLRKDRC